MFSVEVKFGKKKWRTEFLTTLRLGFSGLWKLSPLFAVFLVTWEHHLKLSAALESAKFNVMVLVSQQYMITWQHMQRGRCLTRHSKWNRIVYLFPCLVYHSPWSNRPHLARFLYSGRGCELVLALDSFLAPLTCPENYIYIFIYILMHKFVLSYHLMSDCHNLLSYLLTSDCHNVLSYLSFR